MKISMRKMYVILAIVLSFTAVQAVWAQSTLTVDNGTILRIGTGETGSIDVSTSDETLYTFYDIPFSDLAAAGISLAVGYSVTISAYVVNFPNGTSKYIAYSITYGGVTYSWHPNVPKPGTKTVTLSATDENGQPCYCLCTEDEDTECCYTCNCYCGANR